MGLGKKMLRVIKSLGVILLILLFIAIGAGTYIFFHYPIGLPRDRIVRQEYLPFKSDDTPLSQAEVSEDIQSLIEHTEQVHPIFLGEVSQRYTDAKERLLALSDESMTVKELKYHAFQYLAALVDGHSFVYWNTPKALDIDWAYQDGQLCLLDEDGQLTDKVIVEIAGLGIDTILGEIRKTFPAENDAAIQQNVEKYAGNQLFLESIGAKTSSTIPVTYEAQGERKTLNLGFYFVKEDSTSSFAELIEEDTAYIYISGFSDSIYFQNVLEHIEQYKNDGIKNYIIDVRKNAGGEYELVQALLEAVGVKAPEYDRIIRFSPFAQQQKGYFRTQGTLRIKGNRNSYKEDAMQLYVLVDHNTFSAAQILTVVLKDAGFAKIVGQYSSNSPSFYGNALSFQMENSTIMYQVSSEKLERPDKTKLDEEFLQPDIWVPYGEDALQVALEDMRTPSA